MKSALGFSAQIFPELAIRIGSPSEEVEGVYHSPFLNFIQALRVSYSVRNPVFPVRGNSWFGQCVV